jgi:hypothetical protein
MKNFSAYLSVLLLPLVSSLIIEVLISIQATIQATHWAIESVPDSIAVNHEDDIEPGLPDRRAGGGTRASSSVRWVSA